MRINTFTGDSPFARFVFRNADDGAGAGNDGAGNDDNNGSDNNSGSNGDEGDKAPKITPELEKWFNERLEQAVTGLKKKNEEVIGDNKKLKAELSAAKSKPTLSDEEYSEYKTIKERLELDEFAKLVAEGKSEEMIERVTKRTRLDLEAKIAAEREAAAAKENEAATWRQKYEETLVGIELAKATAQAVKPEYQELVAKLVQDRVKLVDGAVRVVNEDGEIEMNLNGTKPLTVQDYVETMRTKYADLFIVSSGGGAGGSGKKTGAPAGKGSQAVSYEYAGGLDPEEYKALRAAGKIQ